MKRKKEKKMKKCRTNLYKKAYVVYNKFNKGRLPDRGGYLMKKFATLMLALAMLISCAAIGMAEDITLDVIICQYGPKTNDWFTGTGMNGTSFVKKFEEANPGIKLNLEVVSWNDVYTVVSTRISNNNAPDILNLDSFADYANEGLLMPVKDYCPEELYNDFFPSFIEQSVIDGTVWLCRIWLPPARCTTMWICLRRPALKCRPLGPSWKTPARRWLTSTAATCIRGAST